MGKIALKNGINAILDNGGSKEISRKTIRVYGDNSWPEINTILAEWEHRAFLKILIPPETANDNDLCIKMLRYIEAESPWPNWP